MPFRMTSRPQLSGFFWWRRRAEHAVMRHETDMWDDPSKFQADRQLISFVIAALVCAGCLVMAFFRPQGTIGNAKIVEARGTGELYVMVNGRLDRVENLASARLIIGSADKPQQVTAAAIASKPQGPRVGILGAPSLMSPNPSDDSTWSVCDEYQSGAASPLDPNTGLPTLDASAVITTAIGGPLKISADTATKINPGAARVMTFANTTWLVYPKADGTVVRAQFDLNNAGVATALGIDRSTQMVPMSRGLFNAIPAAPALTVPTIPDAGAVPGFKIATPGVKVGSVLSVRDVRGEEGFYVVLRNGVQQIPLVMASLIRTGNSQGATRTADVTPDVLADVPRVEPLSTDSYPTSTSKVLDAKAAPVTCFTWTQNGNQPVAVTAVLAGQSLPLTDSQRKSAFDLVTADKSKGVVADRVYVPADGGGRYVRAAPAQPDTMVRGTGWWIGSNGVRYGIAQDEAAVGSTAASTGQLDATAAALGIGSPVPAPWPIVSLFAEGPTLSKQAAATQRDGVDIDRGAVALPTTPAAAAGK
ncbi:type VII secretion protein EccB [Tsukamurella hominis]|uniref:type VII secretion protein EccB n=1 Tax=Tsukamurella hominis TaxID=1970232 RepID=UPI0039EA64C2